MKRLMIGISGVRGVIGETLTPELCTRLGEAFGTFLGGGTVVVGRDTRPSGEMVKHAVFAGLLASGCKIIDVGVAATPTCAMMIPERKAKGGIVISASHNAVEWNALKFFRADGVYLNAVQGRQLLDIYYQGGFRSVSWNEMCEGEKDCSATERHVEKVLGLVDIKALRRKKYRVVLDACNGAGIDMATQFLNRVGCHVTKLYCEPNGIFPRIAEPSKAAVTQLCKIVKREKAHLGIALDPDADRVAFVSEAGRYIGEEYSLALCARHILGHTPGHLVANVSTSRMIDDVAAEFGVKVFRTPVGEVNVADEILDTGAIMGGEGNGGVIYPRIHPSRDSLTGMALMLQYMLESGQTLTDLTNEIPSYTMIKTKVEADRMAIVGFMKELEKNAPCEELDLQDGVKLSWKDSWVHLRGSNTEPVLRIISEARTAAKAKALADEYGARVEKHMKSRKA